MIILFEDTPITTPTPTPTATAAAVVSSSDYLPYLDNIQNLMLAITLILAVWFIYSFVRGLLND